MNFINTLNVKFNNKNKFAMNPQELQEMYDVILSAGEIGVHKKTLSRIIHKKLNRWPNIELNLIRMESCGGLLAEKDDVLYALESFPDPADDQLPASP